MKRIGFTTHPTISRFIKLPTVSLFLAISTATIPAQTKMTDMKTSINSIYNSYNRVAVAYTNTKLSEGISSYETESLHLNGFGIEYLHGFSLSKRIPLFLETGVNFNFGFRTETETAYYSIPVENEIYSGSEEDKYKFQNINFNIPVNLAYKIGINEKTYCTPYVGINLRMNCMFREKLHITTENNVQMQSHTMSEIKHYDTGWSTLYPEDGLHPFADGYRYQIGWHAGVGMTLRQIYVGVEYGTDFTQICRGVDSSKLIVSLGYTF